MLHRAHDDIHDPADPRRRAEILDALSDSRFRARLMRRLLTENRGLRAEKARLEEQVARSNEAVEAIAYACHRQGRGEGYEEGVADARAGDPHHAIDPDVPAALIYALKAPTSSSGLVAVSLVVHGTEIVATVRPGSDPGKVWASICAEVA